MADLLIFLLLKEVIEIQFEYRPGVVQFSFLPVLIPVKVYLSPLCYLCLQKIYMICVVSPKFKHGISTH